MICSESPKIKLPLAFLLRHHTEPHAIKAAMYGFEQIVLGLPPIHIRKKPRLIDRKCGPGRKMGAQFNNDNQRSRRDRR